MAATKSAVAGLVLALCLSAGIGSDAAAQNKAKKTNSRAATETPSSRPSLSVQPDFPGYTWPEWFLNPPPVPHGIGVSPFWKSDSMRSYAEGRRLAIEDLNASDQLVVTVETAISKTFPYLLAQEFAINDRYSAANAVGLDSVVIDGRLYYLVAARPVEINRKKLIPIPERPQWIDMQGPEAQEEIYDAPGLYKIFIYTKQNSWIKAKQDALSKLSQLVSLQVKSNQKLYNESMTQTIYIKSRIFIQDAVVNSRWSDGTNYYIRMHVLRGNVKALD